MRRIFCLAPREIHIARGSLRCSNNCLITRRRRFVQQNFFSPPKIRTPRACVRLLPTFLSVMQESCESYQMICGAPLTHIFELMHPRQQIRRPATLDMYTKQRVENLAGKWLFASIDLVCADSQSQCSPESSPFERERCVCKRF
jgi:hypothetical protein